MTTLTVRVAAGGDDGYIQTPATFNNNAAGFYYGKGATAEFSAWMRFLNVEIPQGSTINSAKITVKAALSQSGSTVNLLIKGNDVDDASAPGNYAGFTGLARTTASVAWSPSSQTSGSNYDTPEIKSIIQEIVDRAGWASGNDMQVVFDNNSSSTNAYRYATSYDGSATDAPLLTVEYTSGGNTSNFFMFFG